MMSEDLLIIAAATSMLVALHISHKLHRSYRAMSQSTDALAAAVAGLTTSVNALIAANTAPKENTAAIDAATAAVTALKGSVETALAPAAPAA